MIIVRVDRRVDPWQVGIEEMFIRAEVELQERLETMGYRSPTWRLLRALQSLHSVVQLQGESAVTAPPFFPSTGRQRNSGAKSRGQQFSCGRVWTKEDEKNVKGQFARTKIGWCGVECDQQKEIASSEGSNRKGKPSSRGK